MVWGTWVGLGGHAAASSIGLFIIGTLAMALAAPAITVSLTHTVIERRRLQGGSLILVAFIAAGCSSMIPYEPQPTMSFDEAKDVAEELILTQHEAWRPDGVDVTSKYISFDLGMQRRRDRLWGGELPPLRRNGGRAYYSRITRIEVSSWQRKFKTWYVVTLIGDVAIRDKHILRTRDIGKAKQLADALSSLMATSQRQAELGGGEGDAPPGSQ